MPMTNGKRDGEHDADWNAGDRRPAPQVVEQQRRIGAEPEEHAVADRDLAGIAADDVPRRRRDRRKQKRHADVAIKSAGENERIEQQCRAEQNDSHARG